MQTQGTVYTNVDVKFKGKKGCDICGGKGYVNPPSMGYASTSVSQCESCCPHDQGKWRNDEGKVFCRMCGKQVV